MLLIIFKIILASGLLLGLYQWLLAKEKCFVFNRIYLLATLLLSLVLPFIEIGLPEYRVVQSTSKIVTTLETIVINEDQNSNPLITLENVLFGIYIMVALLIFAKSLFSIIKIINLKTEKVYIHGTMVNIIPIESSPFSFFNQIFIGEKAFVNNEIDEKIILHENSHIKQKHYNDLLFMEVVLILFWFNPFFYFFKNSIKLNHEYLADDAVLKSFPNVKNYQELILNHIKNSNSTILIHNFNFINTKKRFVMMRKSNNKMVLVRQLTLLPALAIVGLLSAKKTTIIEQFPSVKQAVEQNLSLVKNDLPKVEHEVSPIKETKTIDETKEIIEEQPIELSTAVNTETESLQEEVTEMAAVETEIPAEFPGGLNVFRSKVAENFDTSTFKTSGLKTATIIFTIDENGNTSNFKVEKTNDDEFGNKALKAVKMSNENVIWKPATRDGKAVSSIYRLPITMSFQ